MSTSSDVCKCALDVPEFVTKIYAKINEISGGVWACSLNCHPYNLVTLWHVDEAVVTVILFNFSSPCLQKLPECHAVAQKHLDILKVTPVIILQDGERSHGNITCLPLLHLSVHMWDYLRVIKVWDYNGTRVKPIYAASAVEAAASITKIDEQLIKASRAVHKNVRESYVVNTDIFSEAQQKQMIDTIVGITINNPDVGAFTVTIIAAAWTLVRLIYEREHLTPIERVAQSANILDCLRVLRNCFNNSQLHVHQKPAKNYYESTVLQLIKLFTSYPEVPYEVLLLSFEYIVVKYKQRVTNRHYLIDLLESGIVHEAGTFTFWPGNTGKKVVHVGINCSSDTFDLLNEIIKPNR